jgi:hypothetical protein
MDIVYKKGAVNHANALSRRLDLKVSLHKLQLLRDWTNNEIEIEIIEIFYSNTSKTGWSLLPPPYAMPSWT